MVIGRSYMTRYKFCWARRKIVKNFCSFFCAISFPNDSSMSLAIFVDCCTVIRSGLEIKLPVVASFLADQSSVIESFYSNNLGRHW